MDGISASVYTHGVKPLDNATKSELINNLSHKLAAALTGCLFAKAAGAVGAVVGEMVGDWMTNDYEVIQPDGKKALVLSNKDYNKILNTAKLTAGAVALLYDFNVDVAVGSAEHAVKNNSTTFAVMFPHEWEEIINDTDGSYAKEQLEIIKANKEYILIGTSFIPVVGDIQEFATAETVGGLHFCRYWHHSCGRRFGSKRT
ncbi:hypothetical protein [Moraxella sp.]|uniref:hypothetical protein n=1 Tax=Moraxella sp. TaxID=479 RepID=UPI0026DC39B5|nr:hypothetical protein [Moraxella sp.]MDO4895569.1 hypothetical protein [Moraxella sp.]